MTIAVTTKRLAEVAAVMGRLIEYSEIAFGALASSEDCNEEMLDEMRGDINRASEMVGETSEELITTGCGCVEATSALPSGRYDP